MDEKKLVLVDSPSENRDPITQEPGSHPIGTGMGSAGGVAAGIVVGAAVGGSIGALVGSAIGAVVGGAAGHAVGEAFNPTIEREYWSNTFKDRPYYKPGKEYTDYEPAYRLGWESARRPEHEGKKFDEVETKLQGDWKSDRGPGDPWTDARDAARDAWLRVRTD
jgi:hypothetical protein